MNHTCGHLHRPQFQFLLSLESQRLRRIFYVLSLLMLYLGHIHEQQDLLLSVVEIPMTNELLLLVSSVFPNDSLISCDLWSLIDKSLYAEEIAQEK